MEACSDTQQSENGDATTAQAPPYSAGVCSPRSAYLQPESGAGQHLLSQLPGSCSQASWLLHQLVHQAQLRLGRRSSKVANRQVRMAEEQHRFVSCLNERRATPAHACSTSQQPWQPVQLHAAPAPPARGMPGMHALLPAGAPSAASPPPRPAPLAATGSTTCPCLCRSGPGAQRRQRSERRGWPRARRRPLPARSRRPLPLPAHSSTRLMRV